MHVFFETSDHALVAAAMIATGFAAGFLYDLLALLKTGKHRAVVALIDVITFLATGMLAAVVLIILGQSRIRYYNILGLIVGGILYALLPHRLIMRVESRIKHFWEKRMQSKAGKEQQEAK